ncbi:MAG: threonine dehydratase [Nevskia sp.]|jgi:threonine dehydratase|nr:threonine dehydratase [Nevskia sp.]MCK9383237.1 threonine dehydratase [Nevskia sp.]
MNLPVPDAAALASAAEIVYRAMAPTPQYAWPLLSFRLGAEVWVKHENHTQTGAFKLRGGLVYFESLLRQMPDCPGVISATRGNHGQSVGFAARRAGIAATIVVPYGNSREKNAAMRGLGVDLIEYGEDFQAAREHAAALADERGLHMIPSYHADLVRGVATYWQELFQAVPDLDVVFVPIGMGSGICAAVAARAALGVRTRIVGVVSTEAPAYALSFEAGRVVEAPTTTQLADGMACRSPDATALKIICSGVSEIVRVSDEEIANAMRIYFSDTHNAAEGAGAAALAAALQQQSQLRGQKIGLSLSGGNVDRDVFAAVLSRDGA